MILNSVSGIPGEDHTQETRLRERPIFRAFIISPKHLKYTNLECIGNYKRKPFEIRRFLNLQKIEAVEYFTSMANKGP
jgi:hypothetical protein